MSDERALPLRLTVVRPPPGVALALQVGHGTDPDLLAASGRDADGVSFDFALRLVPGDPPVLRGEAAQGPPASRFVYVTWGRRAGQPDSPWDRRAKVPLAGITGALADAALASRGRRIVGRIAGTGRDGTPACASVPLLGDGWQLEREGA